jgi:hypothetical protein
VLQDPLGIVAAETVIIGHLLHFESKSMRKEDDRLHQTEEQR